MSDPDTTWLLFDFGSPSTVAEWHAIDDRVMGGVSSSRLRSDPAGHAIFEGNVSLECNGGFASIRSTPADRGRPGAQTCFIEARTTSKRFKLNLLTEEAFDGIIKGARADEELAEARRTIARFKLKHEGTTLTSTGRIVAFSAAP